ncbi:uncharacterized protein LOC133777792 [Humulus lupulus]|uniref:uncharacterized protein LOC133777792 n=1 Tax=Humulus lupulus TaxID=3486 RepID=UPI002B40408C|nr:uncharacterized protein LOC133777792 [Humulus lupulus]
MWVETSDSNALFSVADRLEKLYGGKAYVGLRIPDADTGTRQNIDLVLLTKGKSKINDSNGEINDVEETRKQASILESYLEQRGVALPEGYLSCKVILPNPKCCTIQPGSFPPEVIPYDQWTQQKPETKPMFSGWLKGAFGGGKKEMQESIQQNLNFILSTAPIWDRLELKGNKYVLGEFLEFKGKPEDLHALRNIKRSKVSRLIIQKTSMLGLAHSTLQVLYSPRDYRSEGASASEWKEVCVRSSTEVVFQPQNSTKVRKFKLSSVTSTSLSA